MPDITTYIIVIALVVLSGIFSGLTLGLMSLDIYELKRKIKLGNEQAKKVYPIRKSGNLLLSTLLIGNVAVNSALSIFLGSIASGIIAGLVATTLIVIFGEILPQSLFSRYALAVGANTTWIVYIFIVILYPVTKPIAMILDKFLGAELPTVYSKKEFQEILAEQRDMKKSSITHDDYQILSGGLEYSKKTVTEVMTPRVNTYFIKRSEKLTYEKKAVSIGSLNGMEDYTVTFQSFSKTFAMCGFRVGYCVGPKKFIQDMVKVHHYITLTAPHLSQRVATKALTLPKTHINKMMKEYTRRRDYIVKRLNDMNLPTPKPKGAFYTFSNMQEYGNNSLKFSKMLLDKAKVAVVPGSEFGPHGEGYFRCSFATDYNKIVKAMDKMERVLK